MTRVLMFGFGPLPHEGLRMSGPGLRTWHLLSVLRSAGHDVVLIADRIYGSYPDGLPDVVTHQEDGWTYHSISDVRWHNPSSLRPLVKAAKANCIVGVTTTATAIACELAGDLPLWGDLYGSIMAEAQLKALVYGDDSHLSHFWAFERKAIERADIFSAVSERQQWTIIGELGIWGRLNQWTSGYDFATTIPIASETTPYNPPRKVIRGVLTDENTFVILYSGGYNTWTDVDTLFNALETVMSQRADVIFVSTGGKIDGHDDVTYTRFQRLIEGSPYQNRYHLCGWVPNDDVPAYYLESNVGVNVDRPSYEALLGSRTRVLDWMRAGLPSVSSSLTELSDEVVAAGGGLAYRPGDAADLTRCLLRCVDDRAETVQMGRRAYQLLLNRFTYEATTERLQQWVASPSHAPDFGRDVPKLVRSSQGIGAGIRQAFKQRSLGLGLALQIWPYIARITDALGLGGMQRQLAKFGMRALRLDRPPFKASYLQYDIPARMQTGQTLEVMVKARNDGTTPWSSPQTSTKGVSLSYHWRTEAGVMLVKNGERTPLGNTISGGKSVTLPIRVVAPGQPGCYRLELDMIREGVTWFSEAGSPGPSILVDVQKP